MNKPNNVITDLDENDDEIKFDVDWDSIESNYRSRHYHHRHHRRHKHHSDDKADKSKVAEEKVEDINNTDSQPNSVGESSVDSTNVEIPSEISTVSGNNTTNDKILEKDSKKNKKEDKDKKKGHKHKNKTRKNGKKKWSKKKKFLVFLIGFILTLIIMFLVLLYLGKRALLNYDELNLKFPDGIEYTDGGEFVYYNGHTYQFNRDIASVLFMGIDNTELVENAMAGTAGQADALFLFTYNTKTGAIKVFSLNRDTMTDINRYDTAGKFYDTSRKQLCLAYSYGDGKDGSARNQVTAVERLIYNVPIHAYYAIDLSAIKILNDDVGGVTLTPNYTFGSFTKGQPITIKGDMAEEFVRTRNVSLLDDNLRRIECQKQYITAFGGRIVPSIREDFMTPINLYNDSSKYTVTNINLPILTYLATSLAVDYSGLNIISSKGQYFDVPDDPFAEYELDKTSLFETVLDLYYTQID